jgi:hypothetical protein
MIGNREPTIEVIRLVPENSRVSSTVIIAPDAMREGLCRTVVDSIRAFEMAFPNQDVEKRYEVHEFFRCGANRYMNIIHAPEQKQ